MASGVAYAGATFTLVMTLGCAAGAVWSVVSGLPAVLPVSLGAISVISGYAAVASDWPRVWKPLLTGDKR